MRITKVWDADYPWDVRAEKVASALTAAGHDVHMVARNQAERAVVERLPEATVHRLAPWRWLPRRLDRAAMFPAFFNPRWIRAIERVARDIATDVILCRDLPLAPAAIYVARRLRRPVVLDMAENYPAMLASRWATGRTKPLDVLVRNPGLARLVERWVLRRLDGVLVVVDESRDRVVRLGVDPSRVVVTSNTPPLSRLARQPAEHAGNAPLRIVYLGLMELQRGLATVLEGLAALQSQGVPFEMTFVGGGVDAQVVESRALSLGLHPPVVVFRGWVPNETALASLPAAHVGLVPHWRDDSWNTSVPNKIFDYMAAGLVVVTSDAVPAARIVTTAGAGRVYPDRDAAALAATLRDLADATVRQRLGAAGRAAIRSTYHWELDVRRMLQMLEGLAT